MMYRLHIQTVAANTSYCSELRTKQEIKEAIRAIQKGHVNWVALGSGLIHVDKIASLGVSQHEEGELIGVPAKMEDFI